MKVQVQSPDYESQEGAVYRIILVRHGQTDWNDDGDSGEHFRGRIDIGLNISGQAQAQSVADCLTLVNVSAVYASPLERAVDTARPIADRHRRNERRPAGSCRNADGRSCPGSDRP